MTAAKYSLAGRIALRSCISRNVVGWLVVAFLFFAGPSRAQMASLSQGPEMICGQVLFQATGTPAVGVAVELVAIGGPFVASVQTDWAGRFRFGDVRPGAYTISIELPGYEKIQEHVRAGFAGQDVAFHLISNPSAQRLGGENLVSVRELRIPNKAREALQKGMDRLRKKDAAGSLMQFTRAVTAFPGYYEAYYQMGIANVALGKTGEAEQAFQKAIDLSQGRFTDAQFGMGLLLCQRRQFAEAEPIIRRGLDLDVNSASGQYALARSLLGLGRLEEAEKSARRATLLNPASAPPYLLLANIHLQQHNYSPLLDDLDTYLELEPGGPASAWAKNIRKAVQGVLSNSAKAEDR